MLTITSPDGASFTAEEVEIGPGHIEARGAGAKRRLTAPFGIANTVAGSGISVEVRNGGLLSDSLVRASAAIRLRVTQHAIVAEPGGDVYDFPDGKRFIRVSAGR